MPSPGHLFSRLFRHRREKPKTPVPQQEKAVSAPREKSSTAASRGLGSGPVTNGKRVEEVLPEKSKVVVSNREISAAGFTAVRGADFPPGRSLPLVVVDRSAQPDSGSTDRGIPSTEDEKTIQGIPSVTAGTTAPLNPGNVDRSLPSKGAARIGKKTKEASGATPAEAASDVAHLWQEALDKWQTDTKEFKNKLNQEDVERLEKVKKVEDVVTYISETRTEFIHWRHDKSTLDTFRTLVKSNLRYVQAIGQVVADAASASFPPTASVYKAVTMMISCANSVSADYDLMADFFREIGMFLGCVNIMEGSLSDKKIVKGPLGKILVEIFVTILTLCGMSTRYMSRGRGLHALRNFFKGEDGPLKAAYASIKRKAAQEHVYVTHESFAGIQAIKGWKMDERMDRSDAKQDNMMRVMVFSFDSIDSKLDKLVEGEQSRKRADEKKAEADELTKLQKSFERPDITEARAGGFSDVQRTRLKNTGTWLLQEQSFKSWNERAFRVLWVLGEAGTGKSHLSGLIVDTLLENALKTPRTSVGYFFFGKSTLSVRRALCSVVSQIAQTDRAFCTKTTREIGDKEPDALSIPELWSKFFVPNYQKGSAPQLYIVFDGVDEADPLETDELLQLLGAEDIQDLQIQVLFVGRAKLASDIEKHFKVRHEIIRITSQKNYSDVKLLIESKITASPRLRSLPAEQRDEIIKIMLDKAQGMMLYVDLKISDLEHITQPRSILSAARNLPQGLEKLYEKDLADIEQSAEEQDLPYLNILLRWVTFAVRPLSLRELKCIIKHVYKLNDDFDITSEINLRSGSLFTLIRFGRAVVDESEDGKDQDPVNMDDLFSTNEEPRVEADLTVIEDKTKEQDDIDRQNDDETTIKLRHASLGDYLRSNDIKRTHLTARLSEGELELASLCMQIVCDPNKDLSELWEYAAASWLQHLSKVDDSSLSRTDVFQVALRIAQVLTSPESARQLIHYGDYDNFDWEYTDSATGAKNREVVLKWLIKAHSLGLTTDKKFDFPNSISTTAPDLNDSNLRATNEGGDTVDILHEPQSSSHAETTAATTTKLGPAFGSSTEVPTSLNHVLTAQLEGMMTRSVAAAVQQILKRLKNAGTGQFIFDESMFSGSGDDLELPVAPIDRGGSTQDHFDIGTNATPSYLELGPILAEHRRKELITWIDQVVATPSQILVCFTKMVLTTWYQEDFSVDNIWDAFLMAWTCFRSVSSASQSPLQTLTTYQTDRIVTLNLAAPMRKAPWRHTHRKVQCLVEAFPELETDSEVHIISFDAHLAIGSFLLGEKYRKAALVEFNKSLTIAATDLQRCKARRRIAEIHLLEKNHEAGCELLEAILKSDLGTDENVLEFTREVHASLGEMYRDKGEHARALEAYEAACTIPTAKANPDEINPQYFEEIMECLHHLDRHEAILDKFAGWDDRARDQWLLRALAKTQSVLHIATKTMDRFQLLADYYTGAAKRSNSRELEYIYWFKLADAYWHVLDQPKKALEINQRVFRNATKKLRSTDPSELYMWRDARSQFTLLLWETALNPEACDKEQISQYLSEITLEFALKAADRDDYFSQNDDRVQSLLCARIYKILGQTVEAKKILDQEFNLCIDMLEDNVGSNDIYAFDGLTQVLAVAGCREEAILSYTLLFSNVNPQTASPEEKEADEDSDCDSDDDERDDESPLDNISRSKSNPLDEDLNKESWGCDSCSKRIRNFSEPVYTCLICPNIDLCEACYKKSIEDKSGLRGFVGRWKYCNMEKHEYLRGPVDGWRGVKDGVIRYGGKEVMFTEWLADLKGTWERLAL